MLIFFIENKLHIFTYAVIPKCLPDRILDCCNIVTLFFILDNKKIKDDKYLNLFYKIWNEY